MSNINQTVTVPKIATFRPSWPSIQAVSVQPIRSNPCRKFQPVRLFHFGHVTAYVLLAVREATYELTYKIVPKS